MRRCGHTLPFVVELSALRKAVTLDWTRVLQTLIRWGSGTGIAYIVSGALVELKGTSTKLDLDIFVSLMGRNFLVVTCIVIAIGAIIWALIERKTRYRLVRKCEGREGVERSLDQNRSSSNLTPEGKTNPEDA